MDARLLQGIDGIDAAAWDGLVGRYVALLWHIAFRHGLSEWDAADVVQTTWLRLFENIEEVREPALKTQESSASDREWWARPGQ